MSHSVSLSWVASTDQVSGYNVYRSASAGAKQSLLNGTTLVTGTAYTDSTVTPGSWFYDVTTVENGAESTVSNSVNAVVLPAPPTSLVLVSVN